MATQYDALLTELGVLNEKMPPEDRLIYRMARVFGECEIAMPEDFVAEVKRYIEIWRADQRLVKGLQRAQEQNLKPAILGALAEYHMPPQFFYVALQESDFRAQAVGPETRFGIAKGIWQLMPETAIQYGLRTGPLLDVPQFDPADERFDADGGDPRRGPLPRRPVSRGGTGLRVAGARVLQLGNDAGAQSHPGDEGEPARPQLLGAARADATCRRRRATMCSRSSPLR